MRQCRQVGVFLLSGVCLSACSSFTTGPTSRQRIPPGADSVHVVRIDSVSGPFRFYSGLDTSERLVIRDAGRWQDIWSRVTGQASPMPPAPEIDFSRQMVVLAAMGTRNSGGYAISIDGVYRAQGGLYAAVTETSPGDGCAVTGALTAPVDLVLLPASEEDVVFVEAAKVHDCT